MKRLLGLAGALLMASLLSLAAQAQPYGAPGYHRLPPHRYYHRPLYHRPPLRALRRDDRR